MTYDLIVRAKYRAKTLSCRSSTRQDGKLIASLVSNLEQAITILKPLAEEADARAIMGLGEDTDHWPVDKTNLTLGDFRSAKAFQDRLKGKI